MNLVTILIVAALTEGIVEYFMAPIVKPDPPFDDGDPREEYARGLVLRYLAALVGMLLCLAYQVDLLSLVSLQPPWPWLGFVVTGLLVGRGSNYLNDFIDRWLKR